MLLYYVFKCFIQLIFGCTRGSPKFNAARNFPWRLPLGDHEWLQVQWFIAFNKLLRVKSITQMISNSPYLPWLPSPSNHPKTWCPLHRCTILLRSMDAYKAPSIQNKLCMNHKTLRENNKRLQYKQFVPERGTGIANNSETAATKWQSWNLCHSNAQH